MGAASWAGRVVGGFPPGDARGPVLSAAAPTAFFSPSRPRMVPTQVQTQMHPDLTIGDDAITFVDRKMYLLLAHLCEQAPLVTVADAELAVRKLLPPGLADWSPWQRRETRGG